MSRRRMSKTKTHEYELKASGKRLTDIQNLGARRTDKTKKRRCNLHFLYQWIFVPSNETLYPPRKKSMCSLIYRLDFNAYNPVTAFEELYEPYTSKIGGFLTLAAFFILISYSWFTILDATDSFEPYRLTKRNVRPGRSLEINREDLYFYFENLDSSATTTFEVTWHQCTRDESKVLANCIAIANSPCIQSTDGISSITASCPNENLIVSSGPQGKKILLTVRNPATSPTSSQPSGNFITTLINRGNANLRRDSGIGFDGVHRHKVAYEADVAKILQLSASFYDVETNRRWKSGKSTFGTFETRRRFLLEQNPDSPNFFFSEMINSSSVSSVNISFSCALSVDPVEIDLDYQRRNFYDAISKIGGCASLLLVSLLLFGRFVVKRYFRKERAFKPRKLAFVHLLNTKRKQLEKFQREVFWLFRIKIFI